MAWIRRALFFFQAEDGIRDHCVTGVQTCALPLSGAPRRRLRANTWWPSISPAPIRTTTAPPRRARSRSRRRAEERRVGKECRYRWWPDQYKKEANEKREVGRST